MCMAPIFNAAVFRLFDCATSHVVHVGIGRCLWPTWKHPTSRPWILFSMYQCTSWFSCFKAKYVLTTRATHTAAVVTCVKYLSGQRFIPDSLLLLNSCCAGSKPHLLGAGLYGRSITFASAVQISGTKLQAGSEPRTPQKAERNQFCTGLAGFDLFVLLLLRKTVAHRSRGAV